MKLPSVTLLALLAVLVPTAGARAARVPPGNSAATQYSETVPGAGGEEGSRETGDTGKSSIGQEGGGTKSSVPAGTDAEFEELGPEGEAALNFSNSSGTGHQAAAGGGGKGPGEQEGNGSSEREGAAVTTGPGDSGPPGGSAELSGSKGSSGLGEVLGAAVGTSGGGLDFLQPLILATLLVAAGAYVLRRRGKDLA